MIGEHVDEPRRGSKELVQHEAKQRSYVHLVHRRLEDDPERPERLLERLRILAEDLHRPLVSPHSTSKLVKGQTWE